MKAMANTSAVDITRKMDTENATIRFIPINWQRQSATQVSQTHTHGVVDRTVANASSSNKSIYFIALGRIPARLVLYFLSWSGFLVSFMMRNDINITIVSMVRAPTSPVDIVANQTDSTNGVDGADGEFDWSSTVRAWILGSFYASYVVSQVNYRQVAHKVIYDDHKQTRKTHNELIHFRSSAAWPHRCSARKACLAGANSPRHCAAFAFH